MITTGAAPAAAVMMENFKNHPEQALKQAGILTAVTKLPVPFTSLALAGMQNKSNIQSMVRNQYYSNIKSAVSTQNHCNQAGTADGKE